MRGIDLLQWIHRPALALSGDGTIIAVNAACRSVVGSSAGRFLNRLCSDVVRERLGNADTCDPVACVSSARPAGSDGEDFSRCRLPRAVDDHFRTVVAVVTVPPAEREDDVAAVLLLHGDTGSVRPEHLGLEVSGPVGVRVLGSVEIVRRNIPLAVPRKRARELLTLLTLAGPGGLRREEICETLWPSAARGAGRAHLRVLLHLIRHLVNEELLEDVGVISGVDSRLRLRPDVWTDVHVLEAARVSEDCAPTLDAAARRDRVAELRRVVDCYHGDLDPHGEFGSWVIPHRERLRRRFLALVSELIPLAASVGEFEVAIDSCRRAIAVDPMDERFRLSLLALYGQLGRTEEAQAEYDAYQRSLVDDDADTVRSRRTRKSRVGHRGVRP